MQLLQDFPVHTFVRIVKVTGDDTLMRKLEEIGISIDSEVVILKNTPQTPLLVKIGNRRVAISCTHTLRIYGTSV
ncbi:ferrous iron transport protein A [Candidatus Roizmanbacteria bacterium]|nr:ferrous iron transport protein A [Candidatus Roizmanbacteria bacterium]